MVLIRRDVGTKLPRLILSYNSKDGAGLGEPVYLVMLDGEETLCFVPQSEALRKFPAHLRLFVKASKLPFLDGIPEQDPAPNPNAAAEP